MMLTVCGWSNCCIRIILECNILTQAVFLDAIEAWMAVVPITPDDLCSFTFMLSCFLDSLTCFLTNMTSDNYDDMINDSAYVPIVLI